MSNSKSLLDTDVLVIGAGIAGHTAALSASEAGARVLLIEKGETFGGTSAVSGGGFAFAGTDEQKAHGIDDDEEQFRASLWEASSGKADPVLIDAFIAEQLATYRWMVEQGVQFELYRVGILDKVDRMHSTGQGAAVTVLHQNYVKRDRALYLARAAANRLVTNGAGCVVGATIDHDGADRTVHASRGVVLTTGGFNRSRELLEIYAPDWAGAMKLGGRHNTGDGLRMASALGAAHADMGYVEASFGGTLNRYPEIDENPDDEPMLLLPFSNGAIIVNKTGRRFINEGLNYKQISQELLKQPDGIAFQLFDAKLMAQARRDLTVMNLEGALEQGYVRKADTIAALAAAIGVDVAALEDTVRRYNAAATIGDMEPEFGRLISDFGGIGPCIDTGPFYAIPTGNVLTTTYCGLKVDPEMNVRTVYGEPIAALYAAGEVIGGFHGAGYYSASAMAKAAVFGRIAGRAAAGNAA
ncbi:FAD-dependent oxidoreductase [Sphingopyxis sp. GW247-27LB]|uniref:FAD-dependent oxidoreductase n=1 Tax=Sphingopyxis sp. GW247-27LB TaxID=2012632 RepID=UPI000BA75A83|nr:FAD-dependent oxidoreductase [Sphingopyxis sp. GW247-27LB]PAL24225.1 hypothetical protein CD928_04785 [Sphingopyxis sp. GW247-27LB]